MSKSNMGNEGERIAGALEKIAEELGEIKVRLVHLVMARGPGLELPLRSDDTDNYVAPKKTRKRTSNGR